MKPSLMLADLMLPPPDAIADHIEKLQVAGDEALKLVQGAAARIAELEEENAGLREQVQRLTTCGDCGRSLTFCTCDCDDEEQP
jgi:hypothetical protein